MGGSARIPRRERTKAYASVCMVHARRRRVFVTLVRRVASPPFVSSVASLHPPSSRPLHITRYCGYLSTHVMTLCAGSASLIAAPAPGAANRLSANPERRAGAFAAFAAAACHPGLPRRRRLRARRPPARASDRDRLPSG